MLAREIVERLQLAPHPEGGWYREVFRSEQQVGVRRGVRSAITHIYYLLEAGQISRWHVVDSDEIWHFYGGSPLELLSYQPDTRKLVRALLGPMDGSDHQSAHAIETGVWQAARSLGAYSLVGCSVGPGFDFADFRFVSALPEHTSHFTPEGGLASFAGLL